ncbi:MAG: hypothetical protein A2Z35_03790 [Actinobacteria bacterium RBG_19FT_COMBO_36_27]|nr:MAG: hypothetical protein A2Z35_03790 [Actinobacteria bacterium RBG_19FT_COMBO_36_27]
MKKVNLKRSLVVSLAVVLITGLISFATSCTPKLSFGDLTVCEDINQETYEPVGQKDEFDIEVKKIYATIEYYGVKGEDNYRYSWVSLDTGENILDETLKYSEGESDYFEGYAMSFIGINDEVKVIPPGDYKIEFYHNGELEKTANFEVKKPVIEILEVSLANEVDENSAPVNKTQQFISTEIIYACVKVNYYIAGNNLKAKWYDSNGDLVIETLHTLDVDLFEPSWIAFSLAAEGRDIPADAYKVEIYLNNNLYDTYDFEVSDARGAEAVEDYFTRGNIYYNDKYFVSFSVPDDWIYTESENGGLNVTLTEQSGNLPVSFLFLASPSGDYPQSDQYKDYADEISSGIEVESNLKLVDVQEEEKVTGKGIKYHEFIYLYNDSDNNEWAEVMAFSEYNNRLYILFATVMDDYFDMGESIYLGIMDSLEFK